MILKYVNPARVEFVINQLNQKIENLQNEIDKIKNDIDNIQYSSKFINI